MSPTREIEHKSTKYNEWVRTKKSLVGIYKFRLKLNFKVKFEKNFELLWELTVVRCELLIRALRYGMTNSLRRSVKAENKAYISQL